MNNINKETISISESCIQDVIVRSDGEVDICFTTKDGQDETKLFLKKGEDVQFTVNFGDVSTIGFGGTDNWGKDRLPLYLSPEAGSVEYDSVFVDTIKIQEYAGEGNWCKCELLNNGKTVRYTSLTDNPSNTERVAYFYHTTDDKIVNSGYNEGRPVAKKWCVTVIQNPADTAPSAPEEESQEIPQDASRLGDYKYSVGNITDLHICVDNDSNTSSISDDWWDEDDFRAVMDIYAADKDIKFVAGCGDVVESGSPAEATGDDDFRQFKSLYDVPYWQIAGLRFFTPLGNHDFYSLFESRSGDTIFDERFTNYNSISGRSPSVNSRIGSIWFDGSCICSICPNERIHFDEPDGNVHTAGQADVNFLAYNSYVEVYKDAAGFTGELAPTENRFSDAAFSAMKNYVYSNWGKCKDNLAGWNAGRQGMRNAYSKLNYWIKKGDEMYVFLSVDYGTDTWGITEGWHDRMIHARTILNLDADDPYIRRMKEYVSDTGYSTFDEKYNYQYYSPNSLIWLKEILENNRDKKIFVYSHHPLPNRVGNSTGIPQNGDWSYADISKDGVLTSEGINKGSNTLTGIEFWFINKLLNEHRNVVFFTGHSHISYDNEYHVDNHDYDIVSPASNTPYVYTKLNNIPKCESGWTVALPSLSKPRYITSEQKSSRAYDDAEMTVMEVYENGIRLKGYKVRNRNKDVYDKNNPLLDKVIILK